MKMMSEKWVKKCWFKKYYKHEFYCKRNMAKNGVEVIIFNEKK